MRPSNLVAALFKHQPTRGNCGGEVCEHPQPRGAVALLADTIHNVSEPGVVVCAVTTGLPYLPSEHIDFA